MTPLQSLLPPEYAHWTVWETTLELPDEHDSLTDVLIAYHKDDESDPEFDYIVLDENGENITHYWAEDAAAHHFMQELLQEEVASNNLNDDQHGML